MKIFISIASYCDELLFFTINDCISKAKNPQNISFGIVDQNDETQREKIEDLDCKDQVKYVYINKVDTLGVSWARNIAFSLLDGEDYLLQIDSHMLFDEDNKPIYKEHSQKYVLVLRPHPDTELEVDNAVLRFRAEHKLSDNPINGCHVAGGFIFSSSDFIEEIPYDPFLYFHGEEQSIAIRAYTRGWDIYHPNKIPLYHHYKKINTQYSSQHWDKNVESKRTLSASYLKTRAIQRINRLFYGDGIKGSVYGLGEVRTLDEYIAFSGIDYKNMTINRV